MTSKSRTILKINSSRCLELPSQSLIPLTNFNKDTKRTCPGYDFEPHESEHLDASGTACHVAFIGFWLYWVSDGSLYSYFQGKLFYLFLFSEVFLFCLRCMDSVEIIIPLFLSFAPQIVYFLLFPLPWSSGPLVSLDSCSCRGTQSKWRFLIIAGYS